MRYCRVYRNASVLSNGIVLVDLPGKSISSPVVPYSYSPFDFRLARHEHCQSEEDGEVHFWMPVRLRRRCNWTLDHSRDS